MSSAMVVNVGQYDPIHRVINGVKDSCPSGWTSIVDVEEPYVQEVAKFSVTEYDIKYKENLKYTCIARGWYMEQKEGGMDYAFILEALDCLGCVGKYKVLVSEQNYGGEKTRKLKSFKLVPKN